MIKNYTFALLITLTFISCGKSKEEVELEKAKIELEKTKLELEYKTKKDEEEKVQKVHEQKANVGTQKKITELNMQLQQIPNSIQKAKENIQAIEQFQIGRSLSTKEKQLEEAHKQLNEISSYGEKLKNEIAQLQYQKTFDFQKSPESLMTYIFESCKKEDFSNFRYLCDPYGESDSDVNQICYAELLSGERKKELKSEFEKGRIIGTPKIDVDKAEIEFAFGPSVNKLEKMLMVKRNGFWYLVGF
ncbi:hypothetical protein A9Q86_15360 [Flavobacteriales bacterium 33_180_T64]|nr:hypothetical protein A9Q86_15360 [Flavobacteriales bacterium 33_180_T64]